jgi:nucleoside phosphorylase
MFRRSLLAWVLFAAACGAHGSGGDGGYPPDGGPLIVVFSAFPAEGAAVLEHATVTSTQVFNDRTFRIGTLNGVPVAIGLTGMGLANATATSHAVLAALPIKGVVFSGVAGSSQRVADVVVPASWSLKGTATYPTDADWLAAAGALVSSGQLCFEQCTLTSANAKVCLDHVPAATVGGTGESIEIQKDLPCQMADDDLFGCDIGMTMQQDQCQPMGAPFAGDAGTGPISTDNETAAVAAEAAAKGLPFIGFRGVSDGADDPLHLPGYPTEFFAWYRLAARNAAAASTAFVGRLGSK